MPEETQSNYLGIIILIFVVTVAAVLMFVLKDQFKPPAEIEASEEELDFYISDYGPADQAPLETP